MAKYFLGNAHLKKKRWRSIKNMDVYTETGDRRSHGNLSNSDSFSVLMVLLFEKILDKNCCKLALLAPACSVWSKKFSSSGIPESSLLGFPSRREGCALSWWQQRPSTTLCQASVQKVACGCHRQKERKTAQIKIVFRHFWGCFARNFKKFKYQEWSTYSFGNHHFRDNHKGSWVRDCHPHLLPVCAVRTPVPF